MGSLRGRQEFRRKQAAEARRRLRESEGYARLMTPAVFEQEYRDQIRASWKGGPTVLAFLFAQPDSEAIQMLDARGEYFDVRTGDTWDLFFPGYYRSEEDREVERRTGARSIGRNYVANWYFRPKDFDKLRKHVERMSKGRWRYAGGADLVLINGMLVEKGEPTIDWVSTQGWDITDRTSDRQTLTLAKVVESITSDFETNAEDESYGLRKEGETPSSGGIAVTRDFMLDTVREIAVALGLKLAGF